MVEVVFVEPLGTERSVQAEEGQTLMRAARNAGVEGIIGECGGCLTCGTCHVFVREEQLEFLPPPGPDEIEMLSTLLNSQSNSRLSCQLRASSCHSGLKLVIPSIQG